MEVEPRYKQSEVGVIPVEWDTQTVLGISVQIMDFRGRTPRKLGMEWGGGEIPALSAGNVKSGYIDFSKECYFGSTALYKRWMTKGCVKKDDIVFTTEAPLGNVALIPDCSKYILSQRTVLLQVDPEQALSQFLFQFMLSEQFQRILADYSSGSTAKGIQRKKFEQLPLAKPPLHEQRVIAEALSDVDSLLDELGRLITKKRNLKQAAMQQLLTGQTRLPGFTEPWRSTPIGDLLCVRHGKSQKVVESNSGTVPIFGTGGLMGMATRPLYEKPSVLIGRKGTINKPMYMDVPFWTVDTLFYTEVLNDNCAKFLYYRFCLIDWLQYNEASGVPSLNARTIERIEVECPEPLEQQEIAQVISSMDAEITQLEKRLTKTRSIKQGMMQQLLTGKMRLVQ